MSEQIPPVALRGVSFSYGGIPVLEDVSLTIPPGDLTCLIGPNAGGKTTLLKLILGLIPPAAGEVRVFGVAPARAALRIGYMPQQAEHDPQFPVTALDVVSMGRLSDRKGGLYRKADREAAQQALVAVGMGESARTLFARLSGGQRQRVLIARALCDDPDLLLLDEPTANVDQRAGEVFYDLLRRLNERMTILLVSHDVGVVAKLVKTVICVNRGVAAHATADLTGTHIAELYGAQMAMVRHVGCRYESGGQDE